MKTGDVQMKGVSMMDGVNANGQAGLAGNDGDEAGHGDDVLLYAQVCRDCAQARTDVLWAGYMHACPGCEARARRSAGETEGSEWTNWQGGPCPLAWHETAKIKTRSGDMGIANGLSSWWQHDGHAHDIVAYQKLRL